MVSIRRFDQQNVALHYKWYRDKDLNYFATANSEKVESFNHFLWQIKSILDEQNSSADLFEIYLTDSNRLIGVISIHGIDHQERTCFIDCAIGNRDYAGNNYEFAALRKILSYCFEELQMEKVCTTALDFNSRWVQEVQRLGFKKEDTPGNQQRKSRTASDKLVFGLPVEVFQSQQRTQLRAVN